MDDNSLKTSLGQRIVIIVIAVLLLGATFLTYLFIVLSGNESRSNTDEQTEAITQIGEEYDIKSQELNEKMVPISEKYFESFSAYLDEAKSYNSANANNGGLTTKDLKVGTGKTLAEGDLDYGAFYIGWCSDGSIFSSSFDDNDEPTKLSLLLNPADGLIEGWNQGVVGMKLGGVRQLTIPGELAYGESNENICDGANSPLKFIVMAIESDEEVFTLMKELQTLQMQLYYAYYGSTL